jgi:hypothetical protein
MCVWLGIGTVVVVVVVVVPPPGVVIGGLTTPCWEQPTQNGLQLPGLLAEIGTPVVQRGLQAGILMLVAPLLQVSA